jgi:hypothetical protein
MLNRVLSDTLITGSFSVDTNNIFIITKDGQVGIGTSSTDAMLSIQGTGVGSGTTILHLLNADSNSILKVNDAGQIGINIDPTSATITLPQISTILFKDVGNSNPSFISTDVPQGLFIENTNGGTLGINSNSSVADLSGIYGSDLRIIGDPLRNDGLGIYIKAHSSIINDWRIGIQYLNNGSGEPNVILVPDAGSVAIGLTSGISARLHILGIDNTSSNYSLKVQDSNLDNLFTVRNDGVVSSLNGYWISNNLVLSIYGSENIFVGQSGNQTMTGDDNTAMGYVAFINNTSGTDNTVIGRAALQSNTTGNFNTAIGERTMLGINGNYNTAIGIWSLSGVGALNATGDYNIAIGAYAMQNNLTGGSNIVIGALALTDFQAGSNNTIIGYNTLGSITNFDNSTVIGSNMNLSNSLNGIIAIGDGVGNIRIYSDNNGNIGINNLTPLEGLDILGNIVLGNQTIDATRYIGIGSGTSGSFGSNSGFSGIELGSPQGSGSGFIAFHTHHYTSDSGEKMRIDEDGNVGIGLTTPKGKVHIYGSDSTTNINQRLEPISGITEDTYGSNVSTTNATPTTLQTISVPNNSVIMIKTYINYIKTSGSGTASINQGSSIELTASVNNIGGIVSLDIVQDDYTGYTNAIIGVNTGMSVSGSNVIIQVTGTNTDNINWNCITKIIN